MVEVEGEGKEVPCLEAFPEGPWAFLEAVACQEVAFPVAFLAEASFLAVAFPVACLVEASCQEVAYLVAAYLVVAYLEEPS